MLIKVPRPERYKGEGVRLRHLLGHFETILSPNLHWVPRPKGSWERPLSSDKSSANSLQINCFPNGSGQAGLPRTRENLIDTGGAGGRQETVLLWPRAAAAEGSFGGNDFELPETQSCP